MRISDWSSDVCSSDLEEEEAQRVEPKGFNRREDQRVILRDSVDKRVCCVRYEYRYEQRERYANDIIHNAPEPLEEEWSGRIEKKGGYKKRTIGRATCRERKCQYV